MRFQTSSQKIYLDPESLSPLIEEIRSQERTIVFANGCFELLHVGHTRYLNAARALGDVLIVAVNSDDSMRAIKPDRNPAPEQERMEILAAMEAVDFVVPLVDRTPVSLIQLFKPDIHTKGTDYTLDRIPERSVVESYGGRVELVGGPKDHSTTSMIENLRKRNTGIPGGFFRKT